MNVELRHLRAAIAVADAANFTRAAKMLRIAQPSLSQTIRQLESYLGFKVFNRTTRNVALTHEGELFLSCVSVRVALIGFDQTTLVGSS